MTCVSVHTKFVRMKNVTLSAPEDAIERGRRFARSRRSTLNQLFRDWLDQLGEGELRRQTYHNTMSRIKGQVCVGPQRFSREEMNER